jgi:hypothetical protein
MFILILSTRRKNTCNSALCNGNSISCLGGSRYFNSDMRIFVKVAEETPYSSGGAICISTSRPRSKPRFSRACPTASRNGGRGLNNLGFASNGDHYFTDQGQTGLQDTSGRAYPMRGAGHIDCLLDCRSPGGRWIRMCNRGMRRGDAPRGRNQSIATGFPKPIRPDAVQRSEAPPG